MARMEAVEVVRREQEKLSGEPEQMMLSQKMFKTPFLWLKGMRCDSMEVQNLYYIDIWEL